VPPNWHAVRPPPRLPPLRLRVAACKLGGGGVALGRWGGSNATAEGTRGAHEWRVPLNAS